MSEYDLIIKNGTIVDGTRSPRYKGDIGISNGVIKQISTNIPADQAAETPRHGELSEDEARRLLASFRLMEKDKSREALKALLRVEPGVASFRRRGPPW